jgi:hypothetical protein
MTARNIFAQEEPQYNDTYDSETSTQWDSPAASTHSYSVSLQATDPTGVHISVSDTESRHGSSLIEPDKRKCKRSTTKPAAPKSTIRASTKAIKQEAAAEKPKGRRSQTGPAAQLKKQSSPSQMMNSRITAKRPRRETESPPISSASRSTRTRRSFGLTRKTWSRPIASCRAL